MDSNINIVSGQNFSKDRELLRHEIFTAKLKMVIAIILIVGSLAALIVPMGNKSDLQDGRRQMGTYAGDMSTLASIGGRSVAEAFYQDYGECLIGEARILDSIGTQIIYCYNVALLAVIIFGVYLLLKSINKKKSLQNILQNTANNIPVVANDGSVAVGSVADGFGQLPEI